MTAMDKALRLPCLSGTYEISIRGTVNGPMWLA